MAILTIARLTLREASRRRLLLAVALLTIVLAIFSDWGFHRLLELPCGGSANPHPCSPATLKIIAATLLILLMFMFSFVLALGAAFMGAPSIAGDVESGVALAMLPRPIRRSDVVIGKWLGLAVLITVYAATACGIEFALAHYTLNYSPPHPILAISFVVGEAIAVLTLTLLVSTRLAPMTGGIIVLVLFGFSWMAGIAGAVGAALGSRAIESIGTVSSLVLPTDGLWRGAIYNLEPVVLLLAGASSGREGAGNPFFVSSPPATSYILWSVSWIVVILALATWSFSRREL